MDLKCAILWSGGKESCLAYKKASEMGYDISLIATAGEAGKQFNCHPLGLIELQCSAIGKAHFKIEVGKPYREGYLKALQNLRQLHAIGTIVTGDIAIVDQFHGDWIADVCKNAGLELIRPLWGLNRFSILNDVISSGILAEFNCVKQPWFDDKWLGRRVDCGTVTELRMLSEKFGIDPCGELGEYHTVTVDAPFFKKRIDTSNSSVETQDSMFYRKLSQIRLMNKDFSSAQEV